MTYSFIANADVALAGPLREQARSYKLGACFVGARLPAMADSLPMQMLCWQGPFAGKLAPTGSAHAL